MDFFICIMETIIGVYIIRKAFKKRKELEKTVAELLENVHDFVNKMGFKQTYRHQRYLKIYQKKLIYHGIMQVIYAVFYEDDYIYEMSELDLTKAETKITYEEILIGKIDSVMVDLVIHR